MRMKNHQLGDSVFMARQKELTMFEFRLSQKYLFLARQCRDLHFAGHELSSICKGIKTVTMTDR